MHNKIISSLVMFMLIFPLFTFAAGSGGAHKPAQGKTIRAQGAKMILVAYYSRSGHTRKVAQDIASLLNADIEEIVDLKTRKGIFGYIGAGRDAVMSKIVPIGEIKKDPAAYDIVIIGTPNWGSRMSAAVRAYITRYKGSLKQAAFFVCSGGTGHAKVIARLEELSGKKALSSVGFSEKELKPEQKIGYDKKLLEFISVFK
jgi:flavodoxin